MWRSTWRRLIYGQKNVHVQDANAGRVPYVSFDAVGLDLQSGISATETLTVRLAQPGGIATVERKREGRII